MTASFFTETRNDVANIYQQLKRCKKNVISFK